MEKRYVDGKIVISAELAASHTPLQANSIRGITLDFHFQVIIPRQVSAPAMYGRIEIKRRKRRQFYSSIWWYF